MKTRRSTRFLLAAAIATAGLGTATFAQAHPQISVSLGFPGVPVFVESAPVYAVPEPVYVQPRRVYVQPEPVYVAPVPVYARPVYVVPPESYARPRWSGYDPRFEWEREREWRRVEWHRHHGYEQPQFRGRDHDGDDRGHRRSHWD